MCLTGSTPVSCAMARSWPFAPSPLTPHLLAVSTSPSSGNWCAPPSMALPSLHHHPVTSLPLSPYKRRPSHASPHCTPHHPYFLLSHAGERPHRAPSIETTLPLSHGRFTTAPSPVRATPTRPHPRLPPPPLVATNGKP
jgi:hypothetical protein